MRISTKKFNSIIPWCIALFLLVLSINTKAQTIPTPETGDYVSAGSGNWNNAGTWTIVGGGTVPSTGPGTSANVHIFSGHMISLQASQVCRNLFIYSGGSLINGNTTYNVLNIGTGMLNGSTIPDSVRRNSHIINNGIIGSGNNVDAALTNADRIDIRVANIVNSTVGNPVFWPISTFTFSGTGSTKIASLSPNGAAATSVNPVTQHNKTLIINLNKNIVLAGQGGANAFDGHRTLTLNRASGMSVNENYVMNINSTITLGNNNTASFNLFNSTFGRAGGTYTYNINGTLDLSRTTGIQGFIPMPLSDNVNAATGEVNVTTLNVAGTYIMGSGRFTTLNETNPLTNYSKVALNILDGGTVDATRITAADFGLINNAYFNILGSNKTGKIIRALTSNTNDVLFPIGTSTGYSPVLITNSGPTGNFTVGVINSFTGFNTFNSPVSSDFTLNNRFTILAANSNAIISGLKFGWLPADEASGFRRTYTLDLQKFDIGNNTWVKDNNVTVSSISGTGSSAVPQGATSSNTAASPFLITITPTTNPVGVIATNANYTISRDVPSILPLNILSFTGKQNNLNKQIELKWVTTNEVNTKNFEVQESVDGKSFTIIGNLSSKNTAGVHHYNFTVDNTKIGVLYYRLKQIDLDGRFQFSPVIAIERQGNTLLKVYPNPAQENLTVNIPEGSSEGTLKIYALDGKIVYNKTLMSNELISNINISKLNNGMYNLIISKGKESFSQKFLKH